jgi:broad specificity phosphatase PhoE
VFSILISRHGRVALSKPKFPTKSEFHAYVAAYESSNLDKNTRPSPELIRHIRNASIVFASPSLRARESLQRLDPARTPIIDASFREEPQEIPDVAGRWPLLVWFMLARGAETYHPKQAERRLAMKRRANAATRILINAAKHGPTALVGHGWFNRAIVRVLVRNGWRCVIRRGGSGKFGRVSSEWGYAIFEFEATSQQRPPQDSSEARRCVTTDA